MTEAAPEVIARCVSGDRCALGELFDVYGERVYGICRRVLGRDADAEDAAQQVFLRVLEHGESWRGEARFSTWLFRLSVNTAINHGRAEGRRRTGELDAADVPAAAGDPVARLERRDAGDRLDSLLAQLPDEQRVAVVLRDLAGLSYREMAETLAIPIGTVMSRIKRGRDRLRDLGAPLRHPAEGVRS